MTQKQILFVCLGNICRSPAAEAVMVKKIQEAGLSDVIRCDSAGIMGYHAGERADGRMIRQARKRAIDVTSISRRVNAPADFKRFDLIIGMDDQNIHDLHRIAPTPEDRQRIYKMTDFAPKSLYSIVPDPYYGGVEDFDLVLDILDEACTGLLSHLQSQGVIRY